jgi:hypothetical protein
MGVIWAPEDSEAADAFGSSQPGQCEVAETTSQPAIQLPGGGPPLRGTKAKRFRMSFELNGISRPASKSHESADFASAAPDPNDCEGVELCSIEGRIRRPLALVKIPESIPINETNKKKKKKKKKKKLKKKLKKKNPATKN